MSSIEEQLARDIAAVTGGVVVTESDLRDARDEVDERIDSRRRRDRRLTILAAAVAAVVVAVVGATAVQTLDDDPKSAPPAGPGPTNDADAAFLTGEAPTTQLVSGLWREDNGGTLMYLRPDGTVRFDQRGTVFSDPFLSGTYEIDGDLITVTTTTHQRSECAGTVLAMRSSLPQARIMRSVVADSRSGSCTPLEKGQMVWEQALPTAASLSGFTSDGTHWQPLSDRDERDLYGVFLAEGGGHVLEIDLGGSYYVADESAEVVDQGRWSVRGSDLTLTSSADSAQCSEGDRLVLGGTGLADAGNTAFQGTVEQNTCGGAWTPASWMLIPNEYGT